MNPPRPLPVLTLSQARILAVLVEKERTVPDTYPLTLNSLLAGCNQKTSRDPVLNLSEADLLDGLDALKRLSLIIESSGGRVMRYSQNFKAVVGVPSESVALLATLMLRGPQTAAELRMNSERLHRISDISATEAFLQELAQRSSGALVLELLRQPGARENRWVHLLCGPVQMGALSAIQENATAANDQVITPGIGSDRQFSALALQLAQLRDELTDVRDELTAVRAELTSVRVELAVLYSELGIKQ